jgi:hypothetical protein
VDERIARRRKTTAARDAGHRREASVTDGHRSEIGVGWMDHVGTSHTGTRLKGEDDTSSPG